SGAPAGTERNSAAKQSRHQSRQRTALRHDSLCREPPRLHPGAVPTSAGQHFLPWAGAALFAAPAPSVCESSFRVRRTTNLFSTERVPCRAQTPRRSWDVALGQDVAERMKPGPGIRVMVCTPRRWVGTHGSSVAVQVRPCARMLWAGNRKVVFVD